MDIRANLGYPPYQRLMLITFSHEQVPLLVRMAEAFVTRLKEIALPYTRQQVDLFAEAEPMDSSFHFDVLGPVASPISRIKDRYRFQCVVKYRGDDRAAEIVGKTVAWFEERSAKEKLLISVDVDPQYLM
ncbi:primosome assembly protein PriA [compost metagenome]